MPRDLIIGGATGFGLELGRELTAVGDAVVVTGPEAPPTKEVGYRELDLYRLGNDGHVHQRVAKALAHVPLVDSLVYAADYDRFELEEDPDTIPLHMESIGLRGLRHVVYGLLERQRTLGQFVLITPSADSLSPVQTSVHLSIADRATQYAWSLQSARRVGDVFVDGPAETLDAHHISRRMLSLRDTQYRAPVPIPQ